MFKNLKIYSLALIAAVVMLSIFACGSKNEGKTDDSKLSQNLASSAVNSNSGAEPQQPATASKVFKVTGVTKAAAGKAPDFTWEEEGQQVSFSKLTKGKVVFLNFWGTWCPPCRAEIPDIIEIDKDLSAKDFIIIGVPVGERVPDPMSHVAKYADSKGMKYRNVLDLGNELSLAYGGITGVPTTIIIDKKGNISETLVGARTKAAFMQSITRVLN